MAGAWKFAERRLSDDTERQVGHGPAMRADAESHSIALATFGTLLFEWDAAEDRVARPSGLQHLYGHEVAEIEPTFVWLRERIHPDDKSGDRERFLAQVKDHAPVIRGHYRVRHKDGRWINVKTAGAADYDASGRLVRLVGCTMDMDESAVLEESHARLAAVVTYSTDGIFSVDRHGFILTWNEGATKLYGYTADAIIGEKLALLIPDDERADADREFAEIMAGKAHVFQARRRRRDGREVIVEISGAPIRSANGAVLGLSTIHRDISHARETALADARFAAVVGASHDAIVTLDAAGRVEFWNKGAEELFKWTAVEAVGRPLSFLVPDDRRREHDEIVQRVSSGENVVRETERLTRDGKRVAVQASFSSFLDGGSLSGSAVTFRDISDRLARDAHVHVLLKELSHRSKNLLAIVQGIARQSALRSSDFTTFHDNLSARLRALAHSHDLIVEGNWYGADMHALVAAQTGAFEMATDAVRVLGDTLLLKPEAAQNIGLGLHELASNAIRHGALSLPEGHVEISWQFADVNGKRRFRLTWREVGDADARLPKKGGFGILVLTQITPRALGGDASLSTEGGGLSWTLDVPAENILSDAS